MKLNKKGILGLDTVKAVILAILVLALIAIAALVIFPVLQTSSDSIAAYSANYNESTTYQVNNNATVVYLPTSATLRNPTCSGNICVNLTDGVTVPAANYTITSTASGCKIAYTGTSAAGAGFNNSVWKCNYNVTYDSWTPTYIANNISSGAVGFFNNVPTFFTLLGVVVLILIIAIVVIAVSRFHGGSPESTLRDL